MGRWIKAIGIGLLGFFICGGFYLQREVPPYPLCEQEERIYELIDSLVPWMKDGYKVRLAHLVVSKSKRYGYDPELVLALILVESAFRTKAVSPKKALGLMQLSPHVAKAIAEELGIPLEDSRDIFEPELNINLGLFYLSKLHAQFGDLELALIAYNYGPSYLQRRIREDLPIPRSYVQKVLGYYRQFSHGS